MRNIFAGDSHGPFGASGCHSQSVGYKLLAKLQFPHKKTAPGVPGTMLKEPKLFYRKTGGLCAEGQCFRFAAVCFYPQLMGVVQADKTHITGGVYDLMVVFQINREGLPGGKLNEVLDLLKRAEPDTEFLHKIPPLLLYKWRRVVYNK